VVARAEREGKHAVREFPVFAATALAAIGNLPETIESRSIIIPMRRRAPDEEVAAFRRRKVEAEAHGLRDALAEWAVIHTEALTEVEPEMPTGIEDRAADIWEPLIAIADLAGGTWPKRARAAALEVVAGRIDEDLSVGVRLLIDIRTVLQSFERISSAGLATQLNELEESTWGGWHDGKGLNQRDLAGRLKLYKIASKDVRMPDNTVKKGYEREDFSDAWARYLRDSASATSATKGNSTSYSKDSDVAGSSREIERDRPQQTLPFLETGATRATSATPSTNPVAPVAVNGSGAFDGAYLDAVGPEMDAEAAAMVEEGDD
jgi:hypothetical protein